jgi:hypothetical protein
LVVVVVVAFIHYYCTRHKNLKKERKKKKENIFFDFLRFSVCRIDSSHVRRIEKEAKKSPAGESVQPNPFGGCVLVVVGA